MFKTIVTLIRGKKFEAAERMTDANALTILDQQLRDSATALERAKKALALALAQDQMEDRRLNAAQDRITDLETRVKAALIANNDKAAREGAEAIAHLESDCATAKAARKSFAAEIERLRKYVMTAETRLSALNRGRRAAKASEAVRNLRAGGIETAAPCQGSLKEAEATLARLREKQEEAETADAVLEEMDVNAQPDAVAARLAEQGYGPSASPSADDILARLSRENARTQVENAA